MDKKTIGSFIAVLRKSTGLTQRELAEKLNVSDKAVSRWERDECAPDLSLVPAIAEVLGVTSEEIIRGERIPSGPDSKGYRSEAKTEKQIQRILKSTVTRFKALSMIAVGLTVLGFLAVLFINHVFEQCNVAFFIGTALLVASILYEIALFIISYSKIDDDEFATSPRNPFKYRMIRYLQAMITLNIVLFAFCLPLFFVYNDRKVPYDSWLLIGLTIAVFTFAVCLAAMRFIRSLLISKGIYTPSEKELETDRKVIRLKFVTLIALALVMFGTIAVTTMIRDAIDFEEIFLTKHTFADLDEYKEFRAQYSENYFRDNEYGVMYNTHPTTRVEVFLADDSQIEQMRFYQGLAMFLTFILVLAELAVGTIIYVKKRARIMGPTTAK